MMKDIILHLLLFLVNALQVLFWVCFGAVMLYCMCPAFE